MVLVWRATGFTDGGEGVAVFEVAKVVGQIGRGRVKRQRGGAPGRILAGVIERRGGFREVG